MRVKLLWPWPLFVALAASGCFDPVVPAGLKCDVNGGCPPYQSCRTDDKTCHFYSSNPGVSCELLDLCCSYVKTTSATDCRAPTSSSSSSGSSTAAEREPGCRSMLCRIAVSDKACVESARDFNCPGL